MTPDTLALKERSSYLRFLFLRLVQVFFLHFRPWFEVSTSAARLLTIPETKNRLISLRVRIHASAERPMKRKMAIKR